MRFSIATTVAALSATAIAQSVPNLPPCAVTCFGNNLGSCGQLDIGCICGNTPVITSVSCCVFATCSQADITSTINFAVSLCKSNGVNVNTSPSCPASGSASASASTQSGSAAPSASGSTLASGVSGVTGTSTPAASGSATTARSSAEAPLPTAGVGYSLGMVLAGMLAAAF